jgi:hypothetical protein
MAISPLTEMGTAWIRPNLLFADYSGIGGFFDRRHRRELLNEPLVCYRKLREGWIPGLDFHGGLVKDLTQRELKLSSVIRVSPTEIEIHIRSITRFCVPLNMVATTSSAYSRRLPNGNFCAVISRDAAP